MRTIVDLPESSLARLARLCEREGISRAEAIRRAVARMLRDEAGSTPDPAFGIWKKHRHDALRYEDALRGEWEPRESRTRHKHPR